MTHEDGGGNTVPGHITRTGEGTGHTFTAPNGHPESRHGILQTESNASPAIELNPGPGGQSFLALKTHLFHPGMDVRRQARESEAAQEAASEDCPRLRESVNRIP